MSKNIYKFPNITQSYCTSSFPKDLSNSYKNNRSNQNRINIIKSEKTHNKDTLNNYKKSDSLPKSANPTIYLEKPSEIKAYHFFNNDNVKDLSNINSENIIRAEYQKRNENLRRKLSSDESRTLSIRKVAITEQSSIVSKSPRSHKSKEAYRLPVQNTKIIKKVQKSCPRSKNYDFEKTQKSSDNCFDPNISFNQSIKVSKNISMGKKYKSDKNNVLKSHPDFEKNLVYFPRVRSCRVNSIILQEETLKEKTKTAYRKSGKDSKNFRNTS